MKDIIKLLAIFLSYSVAGKLGLQLAYINDSATAIWAPSGIALAALLLFGYRVWPAIFLGAFFVNLTTSGTVLTALGIAVGNTLEGLVAAYLINTFAHGKHAFLKAIDIFKFTILGAFLSTTISANIGVVTLILGGFAQWDQFASIWFTWWMGDVSGVLIIAPLLMFWNARHPLYSFKHNRIEALLAFTALIIIASVLFGGITQNYPVAFISIPVIVWIAFRFGRRETMTAILILAGFGLYGTLEGYGPFVRSSHNESLLFLQGFIDVMVITAMSLSVAVAERREAQKVSDQIKDEFISLASHELRTPMTAIRGLISMILEGDYGPINEGLKKPLENIHASSDRQIHLINGLLDVSRLQSGRINFKLTTFSMNEVIQEEITALQSIAKEHGLKLSFAPKKNYEIQADLQWFKQILSNLVGNALKYTEKGSVSVSTREDEERAFIVISDSGIGIDPVDQDKLFGRFRQIASHTTTRSIGSGLGLYIAKNIAEKLGGEVFLEKSVPGEGSTFVFTIPRANTELSRKATEEISKYIQIANETQNG